jgi:hypothetical protein
MKNGSRKVPLPATAPAPPALALGVGEALALRERLTLLLLLALLALLPAAYTALPLAGSGCGGAARGGAKGSGSQRPGAVSEGANAARRSEKLSSVGAAAPGAWLEPYQPKGSRVTREEKLT